MPDRFKSLIRPRACLPTTSARPGTPKGVIVVCGGFDEYTEEIFPLLLATADAGCRVVAFDGPGQGGALEEQGVVMTAEWERPVAAVLDHFGLDDVALVGISLGAGLVIRAAAFEPRIRRVIALDVLDDLLDCLGRQAFPGSAPARTPRALSPAVSPPTSCSDPSPPACSPKPSRHTTTARSATSACARRPSLTGSNGSNRRLRYRLPKLASWRGSTTKSARCCGSTPT